MTFTIDFPCGFDIDCPCGCREELVESLWISGPTQNDVSRTAREAQMSEAEVRQIVSLMTVPQGV